MLKKNRQIGEFRFIDYSFARYGKAMPLERSGKFIQIIAADEDVELLILSPYDLSKYHAQILERYAMLNDVEGRFIKMPDFYQVTGTDIEVVGGGHWKIDAKIPRLLLNGESRIYGRFNAKGLADKIRAIPEFRSVTVIVE